MAVLEGSLIDNQVVTDIGSIMSTVTGWITTNPILVIFLTLSFVGIGIGVFRSLKHALG